MREKHPAKTRVKEAPPEPASADARLLTAEQAARVLGVGKLRVYHMVRDKVLPAGVAIRLGRLIRIDRVALEQFLAKGGAALSGGWRRDVE